MGKDSVLYHEHVHTLMYFIAVLTLELYDIVFLMIFNTGLQLIIGLTKKFIVDQTNYYFRKCL